MAYDHDRLSPLDKVIPGGGLTNYIIGYPAPGGRSLCATHGQFMPAIIDPQKAKLETGARLSPFMHGRILSFHDSDD
jgi:hypothetical protein